MSNTKCTRDSRGDRRTFAGAQDRARNTRAFRYRSCTLLHSFGISVLVGVVFGIYPAIRAAKMDPIEALRHE